jgi:hypothetical protein
MAEFFTISTNQTNNDGSCTFDMGKGCFMVWAFNENSFGYKIVNFD